MEVNKTQIRLGKIQWICDNYRKDGGERVEIGIGELALSNPGSRVEGHR